VWVSISEVRWGLEGHLKVASCAARFLVIAKEAKKWTLYI
jgi:hypothetical protein